MDPNFATPGRGIGEHALGPAWQIPLGQGRNFLLDGLAIAIFRTREGVLFATQANCPHRGGPLADGLTDGRTVICPLHDRMYSLSTGEGIGTDCSVQTYPVRIGKDGGMYLRTCNDAGNHPGWAGNAPSEPASPAG